MEGKEQVLEVKKEQKRKRKDTIRDKRKNYELLKTRSSPILLCSLVQELDELHKQAIRDMGLGCILNWNIQEVPGRLSYWLLKRFNATASTIIISETKEIRITTEDVHLYLGLPLGPKEIQLNKVTVYDDIVQSFRQQFGSTVNKKIGEIKLRELPSITPKDVADMLRRSQYPDDMFKRNFLVLFNTLVCESTYGGGVSVKILDVLEDLYEVDQLNWAKYTMDKMLEMTIAWQKSKRPTKACFVVQYFYQW